MRQGPCPVNLDGKQVPMQTLQLVVVRSGNESFRRLEDLSFLRSFRDVDPKPPLIKALAMDLLL